MTEEEIKKSEGTGSCKEAGKGKEAETGKGKEAGKEADKEVKKKNSFFSVFTKENMKKFVRDNVTHSRQSNAIIALSIGYGVFCGCIPLWGLQLIIAGITAHFMRLNPVIVMAFTLITLPPVLPFVILLSLIVGGFVMGVKFDISLSEINGTIISSLIVQYLIGSVALAVAAGALFAAVAYLLLKIFRKPIKG